MHRIIQYGSELLLFFFGLGFGNLAAAGVFTVFSTVAMVPRYVVRFGLKKYLLLMENLILVGTLFGSISQMWGTGWKLAEHIRIRGRQAEAAWQVLATMLQGGMGIFYGIFVGTLALAIAEMLDSIPIFSRRVRLEQSLTVVIFFVALGKLVGAIFYFVYGFPRQ